MHTLHHHHSNHNTSSGMPDRSTAYQLQRRKNLRLALILASVALVFLLGFVFKMAWLR